MTIKMKKVSPTCSVGILGSGPMADEMRAMLEADPDRFRPETWSINPVGACPCCGEEVFRCTTHHTNWEEGFATHSGKVHPRADLKTGEIDPKGTTAACCCVPPNWGPAHSQKSRPRKPRRGKPRAAGRSRRRP